MKKLSKQLLADTVVSARKALKITRTQLAEMTGIHRGLLSRLESRNFTPSIDQLQALAEALSFDPTELFVDTATAVPIGIDRSYHIAVAGTGYVGRSLAVLLAQHNHVAAIDIIPERVETLNSLFSPFQDEYIEKYLEEARKGKRELNLTAAMDGAASYASADFIIIAVPTNYDPKKNFFDCSAVESVLALIKESTLALRVSCFNELDTYAEVKGLKTAPIIKGVCLDPRVGDYYNNPSFGYGGYCLPKEASLYAATKKSNELLAHAYSKLYNIPSTGLRFFTVYGPAGRPDMFYYSATRKLAAGKTIHIFNYGNCKRDFTYIDDIVEGIIRVMQGALEKLIGADGLPLPPYAVYNIGGGAPENLLDYISTLQEELVRAQALPEKYDFEGHRELIGMQPGDVPVTYADSKGLEDDYGFKPTIGIREGLRKFAEWYKEYYKG